MAEKIEILEQDRVDAANFLEQFLRDNLEALGVEGDVSRGSALRDFAVTAMSLVYALFRRESDLIRRRQSLLLLEAEEGEDVDDAADEILSNFFVTRKSGRKSRGNVTVFFSQRPEAGESIYVPKSVLFYKTADIAFIVDSDTDLVMSRDDMQPVTDASGLVVEYSLRIPVVAVETGSKYDVEPGVFANHTRFNAYVTRVENTTRFSGGSNKESTSEMIERARTAITVRDLNSPRAIDATLKEEFTEVDDTTVIGFGNSEMIRDVVEDAATGLKMHVGGHTDVMLRSPISESEEVTAVIGAEFTDPRPGFYILRDPTVLDFVAAGVVRGDILRIYNNFADSEASEYIVQEATPYGVMVSRHSPFPLELPEVAEDQADGVVGTATGGTDRLASTAHTFVADDVGKWLKITGSAVGNDGTWQIVSVGVTPSNYAVLEDYHGTAAVFNDETGLAWQLLDRVVIYSIGDNSPAFDNRVPVRMAGMFTKTVQRSGRIMLPAKPTYLIREVYIVDSTEAELSVNGRVTFLNRTNKDYPLEPKENPGDPLDPALLQYRVYCHNPEEAHSGWQVMEVQVGWLGEESRFDGKTLHVVYDSLVGYESVWEFMTSNDRRLACASVIPRGFHPVYVQAHIRYKLSKLATTGLDETEAAEALAEHINNFDTREDLDASDLVSFLRMTYDVLGYVEPLEVYYRLIAPDGREIFYVSTDQLLIDLSKYDPAYSGEDENRLDEPISVGVSENVVRFLTTPEMITFEAL